MVKKGIVPLMIVLVALGALILGDRSSSHGQGKSPGQRIEISEYGTLKQLRGTYRKRPPSKAINTLSEGYAIGYSDTPIDSQKMAEKFVYAVDDEHSDNLQVVRERSSGTAESAVKALVKTKDQVLKITHEFAFDDKSGSVEVRRTILASQKVQLFMVKLLADNRLSGGAQTNISSPADIVRGIRSARIILTDSECGPGCPPICTGGERGFCDPLPCLTPPQCRPDLYKVIQAKAIIQPLSEARAELKKYSRGRVRLPDSLTPLSRGPLATTLHFENIPTVEGGKAIVVNTIYNTQQ